MVSLYRKTKKTILKNLNYKKMKKLFILSAIFFSVSAFATTGNPAVNEKVLKTFHLNFKSAIDVKWVTYEDHMEASFVLEETMTKALIDNKGNLLGTFRYYQGNQLPENVLKPILRSYKNAEVWGVTEVSNTHDVVYFIMLKDQKNWYKVAIDRDGNYEQTEQYKRSEPK
jgi:hypothetical protein